MRHFCCKDCGRYISVYQSGRFYQHKNHFDNKPCTMEDPLLRINKQLGLYLETNRQRLRGILLVGLPKPMTGKSYTFSNTGLKEVT